MNKNISSSTVLALENKFHNRDLVNKTELRELYESTNFNFDANAFRRYLYTLKKMKMIVPIGAGVYGLMNSPGELKKKFFKPTFSKTTQRINSLVKSKFPYTPYLVWETKALLELMTHQPSGAQIILEVDKDATESVFHELRDKIDINVFLQPDRVTFERYIAGSGECVIILGLITQSPQMEAKGIPSAKLEKILVDVFSDDERFFIYHGQEMINIFENAFSTYWINPKTLFRYANRRKKADELKFFLSNKTRVDIKKLTENIL